jgi:hypothetical protein
MYLVAGGSKYSLLKYRLLTGQSKKENAYLSFAKGGEFLRCLTQPLR